MSTNATNVPSLKEMFDAMDTINVTNEITATLNAYFKETLTESLSTRHHGGYISTSSPENRILWTAINSYVIHYGLLLVEEAKDYNENGYLHSTGFMSGACSALASLIFLRAEFAYDIDAGLTICNRITKSFMTYAGA